MGRGVKKGGERETQARNTRRGEKGGRELSGQTDSFIASQAYLVVAR